jgi:hypothetical protein
MAANDIADPTTEDTPAKEPSILVFPLSLRDAGDGPEKECIRFTIVDRKELEERKSIYLYTPNGMAVADGASYNSVDLGMIGGMMGKMDQIKQDMATGGVEGGKMSMMEAAQNANVGSDVLQGLKNKMSGGSTIGQAIKMKAGEAVNPFTQLAFAGTTPRSFSFTFKMVPESEQEMEVARKIENTFRKFLYPKLHTSALALKYPPFWKIQFMKGAEENKFLPFIQLSYLQSCTATYNATGNVFHPDGAPTEIDIALTFAEAKALTREDLYSDAEDYKTTKYTYERKSPMPQVTAEEVGSKLTGS